MATKTQYRVWNVGACEALTEWTDSEIEANKWRSECEEHETEPECKVVSREMDLHQESQRVEAAYRAAGLMRGPCGVVVRCSQFGILVADDQHTENYDNAEQAIADLDSWRG